MATNNTDIYNMSQVLLDIQKEYFEEQSEDTLALGLYGFINAVSSKMLTNSIKIASEMANEVFPTKARLEKSIITHAITNNITDINAVPAKIDILLCLLESDFVNLLAEQNKTAITIDKNCKFFLGEYEYHLDYDMIVSRSLLANNISVYTARYNMSIKNTLSDIEVPYLASPYIVKQNGDTYIFIACHLRQLQIVPEYNKLITNDIIDNKTYEFEFENQLATFDVYVTEGDNIIHLIPLFEGSNTEGIPNYCWYTYMDSSTIRVKFDSLSYMPKINAGIETIIKTTNGAKCNFPFKEDIITILEDTEDYTYSGMQIAISPTSDSADGQDRKSVTELKRILPKEALSRGSIINTTDLNNYFNTLNTQSNRMVFEQKVHNQFERAYYSYILIKDSLSNIVPTNTIDMFIKESDFDLITNADNPDLKQYIFKQGCYIGYKNDGNGNWNGYILKSPTAEVLAQYQFVYTIPFKAVINHSGPFISYYMTIIDDVQKTIFSYINDIVPLQFICPTVNWSRSAINNSDRYTLSFDLKQNIDMNMGIITKDESGTMTDCSLKVVAVIYDEMENPYRYMVGSLESYDDTTTFSYKFKLEFITPDIINEENCIRIDNTYIPMMAESLQYGYFQQNSKVDIYVLNKFKDESGNAVEYGRSNIDNIVLTGLQGYSVTNKYSIVNGLTFFDNYSEIISTVVAPVSIFNEATQLTENGFKLSSVPVIRYTYAQNKRNIINFINDIKIRKAYIDTALEVIENQFGIDFKFYNTYGPAYVYTIDGHTKLDRVNISFNFNLSLKKSSDDYTKEYIIKRIKDYIENLDNAGDIHIPNLISDITKEYANSIYYIEFRGFNSYGTEYQHFYYTDNGNINTIPEFTCINLKDDGTPDINIKVV